MTVDHRQVSHSDLLHDCGTWPIAVGMTAVVLTCYTIVIAAASVLLILFTAHELI